MEVFNIKGEIGKKYGEIYADKDELIFRYVCFYCKSVFVDNYNFIDHVKDEHISNKAYNNTDINDDEVKNSLESNHDEYEFIKIGILKEEEKETDCSYDIPEFNEQLEEVFIVENFPPNKNIKMKNVEEKMEIKSELYKPKKNIEEVLIKIDTETKKPIKKIRKQNLKFHCDICGKGFLAERSLRVHKTYDHLPAYPSLIQYDKMNDEDETIEENRNENIIIDTIDTLSKYDPLKCRYCERRLKSRKDRAEHERLHTGERPHKCEICGKCFRMEKLYFRHIGIHNNERPYKCEICNKGFKDKTNLNVHIRRHIGEKKYKCSYCDKLFLQPTQKRSHERVHTGEKPYQCNQCGRCFQTSSKLTLHIRRHFGDKPNKCDFCDSRFYTKTQLNDHSTMHTGERPFKCDICDATFPRRVSLRSHKKIHSDVATYICKICGKGFKQHPGLYCHMKSHGEIISKAAL